MEVLVYTLGGYARMYGNRLSGEEKEVPRGKGFRSEKGVLPARFRLH
jgi:hypothetical protein